MEVVDHHPRNTPQFARKCPAGLDLSFVSIGLRQPTEAETSSDLTGATVVLDTPLTLYDGASVDRLDDVEML